MATEERKEIIEQLRQNVMNGDFWDMVACEELNKLITALEEEWS